MIEQLETPWEIRMRQVLDNLEVVCDDPREKTGKPLKFYPDLPPIEDMYVCVCRVNEAVKSLNEGGRLAELGAQQEQLTRQYERRGISFLVHKPSQKLLMMVGGKLYSGPD